MSISRITRITVILAVVLMVAGLTACDEIVSILNSLDAPDLPEIDINIPVGVVVPLSGEYPLAFGQSVVNGFELARKEINSLQADSEGITFIIVDDMATLGGARQAFNQLIEQDGVPVILGPCFSFQASELFPIASEGGVVAFSSTSSASGLNKAGDANFRAGLTTGRLNPPGVMKTHAALGYRKVATMYDEADLYSTVGHDDLTGALTAAGVEILATTPFKRGDTDFSAQLTQIKELNPDAIFISALSGEMSQILVQGRALGIPASIPFIVPELSSSEVEAAGEAAEGAISFTGWSILASTPGNAEFIESYRAAYGSDPGPWAAQSYATLYILAEAILEAESTESAAIAEALRNIRDLDTMLGSFSFDENGDAIYQPHVLIVKDGELELFE